LKQQQGLLLEISKMSLHLPLYYDFFEYASAILSACRKLQVEHDYFEIHVRFYLLNLRAELLSLNEISQTLSIYEREMRQHFSYPSSRSGDDFAPILETRLSTIERELHHLKQKFFKHFGKENESNASLTMGEMIFSYQKLFSGKKIEMSGEVAVVINDEHLRELFSLIVVLISSFVGEVKLYFKHQRHSYTVELLDDGDKMEVELIRKKLISYGLDERCFPSDEMDLMQMILVSEELRKSYPSIKHRALSTLSAINYLVEKAQGHMVVVAKREGGIKFMFSYTTTDKELHSSEDTRPYIAPEPLVH
ncbi:MAG: hypothetical protein HQK50_08745, partial [Oligoflexia bacterium]|nr:hypothetical protein [Oligoflexia bacterium]